MANGSAPAPGAVFRAPAENNRAHCLIRCLTHCLTRYLTRCLIHCHTIHYHHKE